VSAFRRAGILRYAASQFVVLTVIAMALYAGGTWFDPATSHYHLAHNFLSDLGATRAFSGRANYASAVPFAIALVTIGAALVAFAWSWREFAFGRERARVAGVASALIGTGSGAAFAGIALAPIDHALRLHNDLVLAAFGLLLAYVACLTFLMWRNGVGRLAANIAYLALVCGYVGLVVLGPRLGTEHGFVVQVIGQKIVVYGSMAYVIYLTTTTRRALATGSRRC
jgi:hypothetical protein